MSRSALSYPLSRHADLDAGGAADLQTDVMRFMAILSLCLVAIFALVQSIPLVPPIHQPEPVEPAPIRPAAPEPVAESAPEPISEPVPEPAPILPDPPEVVRELPPRPAYEPIQQPITQRPIPQPEPADPVPLASSAAPVPDMAPVPAPVEPEQEGFTLRFESDLALRRLVARDEIGLYAIRQEEAQRMSVNRGALSFWSASVPGQFHEMDQATVPGEVVTALRRSGTSGNVKWGVTLPSRLSSQLNRFLSENPGGALIIGGDGRMRLE